MTPRIDVVELPGRVKLPYAEQGDSSGVPVLLLHGYTDSWRSFEGVLPHLPEAIRAFVPSQRGHGDADRPMTGYRPHDFAADVAAFMDALAIESAVVAGHSMGSCIAQRFATDYPDRVRGLVLMGAFKTLRGNPVLLELWDSLVSTLADPIDPGVVLEFQQSTLARPVSRAFLDTVVQESLKVPARVWRAAFEGLLEADFSREFAHVRAPTLILWGDRDEVAPRSEQESLAVAIAGSRLVAYPGAGHGFHWEEPERFAADLVAFVESLDGRGLGGRRSAA
ncbi:MAG: alpha/beta hydrolase [Pseudomonadota bacterium]|nr:alpha/beta hydrolase [Pseudomonadota bacterium]